MRFYFSIIILCFCLLGSALNAVEPDEMLANPALEARARALSKELRCLVCRNENIDSSDAGIARDLRLLVRKRLLAGDDDAQVLDYVVARYGEFVLLRPPLNRANLALYLAGPIALLLGVILWIGTIRRRQTPLVNLSAEEQMKLDEILKD